jgi:hypothetical protein
MQISLFYCSWQAANNCNADQPFFTARGRLLRIVMQISLFYVANFHHLPTKKRLTHLTKEILRVFFFEIAIS